MKSLEAAILAAPAIAIRWGAGILVALALAFLQASNASAATVALGDLLVEVDNATGTILSSSNVAWDDAAFSVFGESTVNLGDPANGITPSAGAGWVGPVSGVPPAGSFTSTITSLTPGVLLLTNAGDFICPDSPGPDCGSGGSPFPASFVGGTSLSGTFVNGGPGTLPTNLTTGEPLSYTFDGSVSCSSDGITSSCLGRIAYSAFAPVNTPASPGPTDVPLDATYTDPNTGTEEPIAVHIYYPSTGTDGTTNVTTTSETAGQIPANFLVESGAYKSPYLEIFTDADPGAPIVVCVSYPDDNGDGDVDGTDPAEPECAVRLLHKEGGVFVNRTLKANAAGCPLVDTTCPGNVCLDPAQNLVCGEVSGFSEFVNAIMVNDGFCPFESGNAGSGFGGSVKIKGWHYDAAGNATRVKCDTNAGDFVQVLRSTADSYPTLRVNVTGASSKCPGALYNDDIATFGIGAAPGGTEVQEVKNGKPRNRCVFHGTTEDGNPATADGWVIHTLRKFNGVGQPTVERGNFSYNTSAGSVFIGTIQIRHPVAP